MVDVFIICHKLRQILIDIQSNPPKRPQSAVSDVEGVEYLGIRRVRILTSYDSNRVLSILHDTLIATEFLSPSVITVELTALYFSVYVG